MKVSQRERFYFQKINIQNKSAAKTVELRVNPPCVSTDKDLTLLMRVKLLR